VLGFRWPSTDSAMSFDFERFAECALSLAIGYALWVLLIGLVQLFIFAFS
jgi:hypothetical protein